MNTIEHTDSYQLALGYNSTSEDILNVIDAEGGLTTETFDEDEAKQVKTTDAIDIEQVETTDTTDIEQIDTVHIEQLEQTNMADEQVWKFNVHEVTWL